MPRSKLIDCRHDGFFCTCCCSSVCVAWRAQSACLESCEGAECVDDEVIVRRSTLSSKRNAKCDEEGEESKCTCPIHNFYETARCEGCMWCFDIHNAFEVHQERNQRRRQEP